jgi:hypothetical protein
LSWLAYLFGGLVGAVLVIALFDWALLILSSLTGSAMIVQTIGLQAIPSGLVFVVLAGLGVAVQARLLMGEQGASPSSRGYAIGGGWLDRRER